MSTRHFAKKVRPRVLQRSAVRDKAQIRGPCITLDGTGDTGAG